MIATAFSSPARPGLSLPPMMAAENLLLFCHSNIDQDLLSSFLKDTYHLSAARSERNVMRLLERQVIHLVIIQAGTARFSECTSLCATLRSSPIFGHIPIVVLLPASRPEMRMACLEAGADAWIEAPLSRDYLRAQIRSLATNRARLKNYYCQSSSSPLHPEACTGGNESFLLRLRSIITDHLADPTLNVDILARELNMSRPTLYRRIKCISDQTPNELINTLRLAKAADLLSSREHKILDIARMVGFHSRSNFGKAFLKQFGVTARTFQRMTIAPVHL